MTIRYSNLSAPFIFEGDIFKKMNSFLEGANTNPVWSSDPYDIYKDKDGNVIVEFALVGLDQEDISVSVSGQTLKVEASAKKDSEKDAEFYHKKIARRSLKKHFTLHQSLDKESIEAEYKNGLLKIKIPLEKEAKRDIMIKVK
jgi:HSP20 family protein